MTHEERAQASENWLSQALEYAQRPIKNVTSALVPIARNDAVGPRSDVIGLTDYLREQGPELRRQCLVPAAFWQSAIDHLRDPASLARLAHEANQASYKQIACRLLHLAAEAGDLHAAHELWWELKEAGYEDAGKPWLVHAAREGDTHSIQSYEDVSG